MKNATKYLFVMFAVCFIIAVAVPASFAATIEAEQDFPYALGDIPLDAATYESLLKDFPDSAADALPVAYDARDDGIVTSPKDQGSCGSCWAFASVGAFESHLLKEYSFGPTDLSEQQLNSCHSSMAGCCGGSLTAPQFWETQGPNYESCFPYGDGSTSCPTYSSVPCSDGDGCEQLASRVINFYTLTPGDFKTSCYEDGPSYWRFNVYSDFNSYWSYGSPGEVYVNTGGSPVGGHAVLIIGWDDAKGAYLMKNSWGATGGPNGDGTFWIAYSGHRNNLNFQMSNFNLTAPGQVWDLCFRDTQYTPELQLSREDDILRGQAILAGSPSFPAALTGQLWSGWANFGIKYGNGNIRFYAIEAATLSGFTWGVFESTGEIYDAPHAAQLVACSAAGAESEGDDGSGGDIDPITLAWNFCYKDTQFTPELEFDVMDIGPGKVMNGQAILAGNPYFPAALTGFVYSGKAMFCLGYLLETGFRFYEINVGTLNGTTWGVSDGTAEYYDLPQPATLAPCAMSFGGFGGTGADE